MSNLSVQRVVSAADGKETLEPAGTAKPGDLLEYAVEYRNTTDSGVRKLEATLPIPQNTEYLPGSGKPAAAQASLDGAVFAPIPLTRTVRQADGKDVVQRVPYAEYRYLRWLPKDLAAHDATRVSARVRLSADAAPSAAK